MKPEAEMGARERLFFGDDGYTAAVGEKLCNVESGPADLVGPVATAIPEGEETTGQ
ncbi:unnamed protein product [Arabis nemorensis]|uniref:Uncharacterized protein n=1 Tax=Arabis nemorensis TaxID=586526 RepID=A0A565AXM2_9BRAS|nr:unnamed protein product [Arabis nemorensis]